MSQFNIIKIYSIFTQLLLLSHFSRVRLCATPQTSDSPVPGILQARTLEWVAISFSNAWKLKVKVKPLSPVRLLATPWTAAHQAPPPMRFSRQEYWSGMPLPSPFHTTVGYKFYSSSHPVHFLMAFTPVWNHLICGSTCHRQPLLLTAAFRVRSTLRSSQLYPCGPAQGLVGSSGWMRLFSGWIHQKSPILLHAPCTNTNMAKLERR